MTFDESLKYPAMHTQVILKNISSNKVILQAGPQAVNEILCTYLATGSYSQDSEPAQN